MRPISRLSVNDPVNFTQPVELSRKWLHIPGEEIIPFECLEASDSNVY
jgi:hypothetical protein